MNLFIDQKLKHIRRDRTFKARITEKVCDGKYTIIYQNRYYTARCPAELTAGETVYVCAPDNNWSELFINLSCSRREFEAVKSNKTDKLAILAEGTDFNNVTVSGFYRFNSRDNYFNAPPNSWGQLLVIHGGGDTIAQISFDYNSAASFYLRTGNPPECGGTGAWQAWHKYTGVSV